MLLGQVKHYSSWLDADSLRHKQTVQADLSLCRAFFRLHQFSGFYKHLHQRSHEDRGIQERPEHTHSHTHSAWRGRPPFHASFRLSFHSSMQRPIRWQGRSADWQIWAPDADTARHRGNPPRHCSSGGVGVGGGCCLDELDAKWPAVCQSVPIILCTSSVFLVCHDERLSDISHIEQHLCK